MQADTVISKLTVVSDGPPGLLPAFSSQMRIDIRSLSLQNCLWRGEDSDCAFVNVQSLMLRDTAMDALLACASTVSKLELECMDALQAWCLLSALERHSFVNLNSLGLELEGDVQQITCMSIVVWCIARATIRSVRLKLWDRSEHDVHSIYQYVLQMHWDAVCYREDADIIELSRREAKD